MLALQPCWGGVLSVCPCFTENRKRDGSLPFAGVPTPAPLTIDGGQDDTRVVIRDHVCIAVFGLVHFQVGVLPGELLTRVNGLEESGEKTEESEGGKKSSK